MFIQCIIQFKNLIIFKIVPKINSLKLKYILNIISENYD